MALPLRPSTFLPLLLLAVAILVLTGSPAVAIGADGSSACKRWGELGTDELTRGQARRAIHCLVNRERTANGLRKLSRQRRLQRAAQRHSRYMRRHGCFEHQCKGGPSLEQRVRRARYLVPGLRAWSIGENIAWGERWLGTPAAIVKAWMRSEGHRANILNPHFRDLGVGVAHGTPESRKAAGGIYTTDFGMRSR